MNEKGILGYYNIFVIVFLFLSLSIDSLINIVKYSNNLYNYEFLISIQSFEDTLHKTLKAISELDKIPKRYYDINNEVYEITIIDKEQSLYELFKFEGDLLSSSFAEIHLIVEFKDNKYKIIEMEYTKNE